MNDLLALLLLIEKLNAQVGGAIALARKMREEGRDTLTAEELEGLQAADDAARQELSHAIARARADGR
jgi:hypothetical protein